MDKSLVFSPGCDYKFVKEYGHDVMYVEYEAVNGEFKRQRFDLTGDTICVIDGHMEDCEKGVPNTKLIGPNGYFDTDMAMTREEMQYCLNDVAVTEKLFKEEQIMRFETCKPTIKNVIFNAPATIVMWSDGTKTVVKCGENDVFDLEKGIAMCCMKKLLGTNKTGSNYLDKVQEYFDKYDEDYIGECKTIGEILSSIFGSSKKSKDIPPEVTVEKEFEVAKCNEVKEVEEDEE